MDFGTFEKFNEWATSAVAKELSNGSSLSSTITRVVKAYAHWQKDSHLNLKSKWEVSSFDSDKKTYQVHFGSSLFYRLQGMKKDKAEFFCKYLTEGDYYTVDGCCNIYSKSGVNIPFTVDNNSLFDYLEKEWKKIKKCCPHCGKVYDQDIDAAKNILKLGILSKWKVVHSYCDCYTVQYENLWKILVEGERKAEFFCKKLNEGKYYVFENEIHRIEGDCVSYCVPGTLSADLEKEWNEIAFPSKPKWS